MTNPQSNQPEIAHIDSSDQNIQPGTTKIDPKSLLPILTANRANVSAVDGALYIDFSIIDPAIALGLVDTDEPLRETLVARVCIGPGCTIQLTQQLAAGLADLRVPITLVIDKRIAVNNYQNFGPVNK